jgi:hypothetical protein
MVLLNNQPNLVDLQKGSLPDPQTRFTIEMKKGLVRAL